MPFSGSKRRVHRRHPNIPADLPAPRVNADAADRPLVCRLTFRPVSRRASAMAACSRRSSGRRMPDYHQAHWLPTAYPCTVRGRPLRPLLSVSSVLSCSYPRWLIVSSGHMRGGDLNLDLDILLERAVTPLGRSDGRSYALALCLRRRADNRIVGSGPMDRFIHIDLLTAGLSLPRSSISTDLVRIATLYGVFSCAVSFHANLET